MFFIFICEIIIASLKSVLGGLVRFLTQKLLCRTITSVVNGAGKQNLNSSLILFLFSFLLVTLTDHKVGAEERGPFLYLCNISSHSWIFKQSVTVLHLRWRTSIFDCNLYNWDEIYTSLEISIWLNVNFMLVVDIMSDFTAWKVSLFGVFLVRIFSHSNWIWNDLRSISPYSVRMQENTDQKNSENGHFLRSAY